MAELHGQSAEKRQGLRIASRIVPPAAMATSTSPGSMPSGARGAAGRTEYPGDMLASRGDDMSYVQGECGMTARAIGSGLGYVFRQRCLYFALLLWLLLCIAAYVLGPSMPRLTGAPNMRGESTSSSAYIVLVVLAMGLASLLARHRAFPDLGARAPDRATALREIAGLWVYVAVALVAGQFIGRHFSARVSRCI